MWTIVTELINAVDKETMINEPNEILDDDDNDCD